MYALSDDRYGLEGDIRHRSGFVLRCRADYKTESALELPLFYSQQGRLCDFLAGFLKEKLLATLTVECAFLADLFLVDGLLSA